MDVNELTQKYRISEGEVHLPTGTIRVRGLSRAEVFRVQEINSPAEADALTLNLGMVDPKISMQQARDWQSVSPAYEIELVTDKINDLSKPTLSNKDVMNSFRESGD